MKFNELGIVDFPGQMIPTFTHIYMNTWNIFNHFVCMGIEIGKKNSKMK